jgi:DNA-directed RNA polymerase subunit E'
MRARITAVSLGKGSSMGKIGITCRQPFLGSFDWIQEEIEKSKQPQPQKEKKGGGTK